MLFIEDLQVELAGRVLLKDIHLEIKPGETHMLFGPNGSGKTALLTAIMGYPQYEVKRGRIIFKGQDIMHLSIVTRQNPCLPGKEEEQQVVFPRRKVYSKLYPKF
jgi:Fe-S cluster assembly ATP-binding protein